MSLLHLHGPLCLFLISLRRWGLKRSEPFSSLWWSVYPDFRMSLSLLISLFHFHATPTLPNVFFKFLYKGKSWESWNHFRRFGNQFWEILECAWDPLCYVFIFMLPLLVVFWIFSTKAGTVKVDDQFRDILECAWNPLTLWTNGT